MVDGRGALSSGRERTLASYSHLFLAKDQSHDGHQSGYHLHRQPPSDLQIIDFSAAVSTAYFKEEETALETLRTQGHTAGKGPGQG